MRLHLFDSQWYSSQKLEESGKENAKKYYGCSSQEIVVQVLLRVVKIVGENCSGRSMNSMKLQVQ